MSINLTYTGEEALEMTQKLFPKNWEEKIQEGIEKIKRYMRTFNMDAVAAYQKYINWCGKPDDGIIHLAALHLMNKRMKSANELKEIQEKMILIKNNAAANETIKTISSSDKSTLREYYNSKYNELDAQYRVILNDFPVFCHEEVVYQPKLL